MYLFCNKFITADANKSHRPVQKSERETFNVAKSFFYLYTNIHVDTMSP